MCDDLRPTCSLPSGTLRAREARATAIANTAKSRRVSVSFAPSANPQRSGHCAFWETHRKPRDAPATRQARVVFYSACSRLVVETRQAPWKKKDGPDKVQPPVDADRFRNCTYPFFSQNSSRPARGAPLGCVESCVFRVVACGQGFWCAALRSGLPYCTMVRAGGRRCRDHCAVRANVSRSWEGAVTADASAR